LYPFSFTGCFILFFFFSNFVWVPCVGPSLGGRYPQEQLAKFDPKQKKKSRNFFKPEYIVATYMNLLWSQIMATFSSKYGNFGPFFLSLPPPGLFSFVGKWVVKTRHTRKKKVLNLLVNVIIKKKWIFFKQKNCHFFDPPPQNFFCEISAI
jgi:hypothetical protein